MLDKHTLGLIGLFIQYTDYS